jgi:hypothetical protein
MSDFQTAVDKRGQHRFIDLTGTLFGRLIAVERAPNKRKKTAYICLCECNNSCTVTADSLRNGKTRSCGCLHKDAAATRGRLNRLTDTERIESRRRKLAGEYRRHLRLEFNTTPEEVERKRVAQNNKCAICQTPFTSTPHQDHNHTTGELRGLLCGLCNPAIGMLKEDTNILRAAIAYLESYVQ